MSGLTPKLAAGAVAVALVAGGAGVGTLVSGSESVATTPPPNCEDWGVQLSSAECFAAGTIRYIALYNLQGASQFCVWRKANPGEWKRLKGYASNQATPADIVTWFGASIQNELQAYFVTGAPPFTIVPNTAPNKCRTPLPAPVIAGVTPGETGATVTIAP